MTLPFTITTRYCGPDENLVVLEFPNQYAITSTLMRMQEFYESPFPNIRDHFFTVEQYMDTYAVANGNKFSYFDDWNGFNIPGDSVKKFFVAFRHDLLQRELFLLTTLLPIICSDKPFYVIGIHHEGDGLDDLNHEIAHAMYFLNSDYFREQASNMDGLESCFPDIYKKLPIALHDMGYGANVIYDEMQAYLSTSTISVIRKHLGGEVANLVREHNVMKPFRNTFNKYKDQFGLTKRA